jgi:hypothetical protein
MREIRPSGLMRGGEKKVKLTTAVGSIRPFFSLPTLPKFLQLPVKPETIQVKVLSGELSCSLRKKASTSQPRGQGVNHGVFEQPSRNEDKPHPMSPERGTTGQSIASRNLAKTARRCQ